MSHDMNQVCVWHSQDKPYVNWHELYNIWIDFVYVNVYSKEGAVWALQRDYKIINIYRVSRKTILSRDEDNVLTGFSCMRGWLWWGTVLKVFKCLPASLCHVGPKFRFFSFVCWTLNVLRVHLIYDYFIFIFIFNVKWCNSGIGLCHDNTLWISSHLLCHTDNTSTDNDNNNNNKPGFIDGLR